VSSLTTVFLAGDVMTGRGIDQVLPHPSDPALCESYVRDARDYVELAERANGRIESPVDSAYVWGVALAELDAAAPDARIINLETSVTQSPDYWPSKGIHYRMHPRNIGCLTVARIDCCTLANNHVLDFGYAGLAETLATLHEAHLRFAGAGANAQEAGAPATIDLGQRGRVSVYACGAESSGIPEAWNAGAARAGINLLPDLSGNTARRLSTTILESKRAHDVVVLSIHWGPNWGYEVERDGRAFAHALIDSGAVDIIHGHSSHHPKGIELYRGRPILYGCGDFLNDYEGIGGHERYRGDLVAMYFVGMDVEGGGLASLRIVPLRIRRFSLARAVHADAEWLRRKIAQASPGLEGGFELAADNAITLRAIS
jgi:poly-gamma-glutamate synthesis protein (capsule biosynthesis protein)